ncbi:MAG: stalk domain-containing protein [Bacillota bacterium]|jgi:uncharacterized protein YkwD
MFKNKKILIVILACALIMAVTIVPALATQEVKVVVNGTTLQPDVAPVLEQGRVLVPVRAVAENLGCCVNYQGSTKKVTLSKGSDIILLYLNKTNTTVNGKSITLDVPAKVIKGRTLVPIRFVGESLKTNVNWNNKTKTVMITDSGVLLSLSDTEKEFIKLVNDYRKDKGLKSFSNHNTLIMMAQAHSKDMAEKGFFSHNSPTNGTYEQRVAQYGLSNVGENIAYGFPSAQSFFDALITGEGNSNILSPSAKNIGVSIRKKNNTTNTDFYLTMLVMQ